MAEPKVTIYSTRNCGYCRSAKTLLTQKGVPFREIDLSDDYDALVALKRRVRHTTVPMIFVGDAFIGGYDELARLVRRNGVAELMPTA